MKLKIIYRKNLKMTEGKIAAQCCHAVMGLNWVDPDITIVVLGYSDKKYNDLIFDVAERGKVFCEVFDAGYTEVKPNTNTCFAYIE